MMQVQLCQFAKCIFSFLVIAGVASSDPPDSPCPELFQYKFDGSDWIGLIELKNIKVNQTVVNIIAELSLSTSLPSPYKGRLDLLEEHQQAVQAVLESRPLFYRISFPLKNPIPRVTAVVVDNNVLCSGPPDQSPQTVRFQLHHVFYPNKIGGNFNEGSPCLLTDGTSGFCTIIDECMSVSQGLVNYVEIAQNRCGFVNAKEIVCCKDRQPDSPIGIPENSQTKPIQSKNSRKADEACAKYSDAATTIEGLIGLPHVAALGDYDAPRGFLRQCMASLISDRYLLTSANCITQNAPTRAKIGRNAIFTEDNNDDDFLIDEMIKHPNYTFPKSYDDIALIKVNRKVHFTWKILPACLFTNQASPLKPEVMLIGWIYGNVLPEVINLEIVFSYTCSRTHNRWILPHYVLAEQFCAFGLNSNKAKDRCTGGYYDGFLQTKDKITYTIYGVSSFRAGCVYTQISSYIDWIESIVWP